MIFKRFENLNKKLNIKKKDVVFFHLNLASFREFFTDVKEEEINYFAFFLLKFFFNDRGTFIIPSFNYEFCKGVAFTKKKTKSEVGKFSNFLITKYPENRSSNPIFSILSFGGKSDKYISSSTYTCFGKDSCFEKLAKHNGKICFFGSSFDKLTFIHYLEEKYQVHYRKHKVFIGIADNKKVKINYFVRNLNSKKEFNFNKLKNDLLKKKKIRRAKIGRHEFLSVTCKDIEMEFKTNYKKNINYYLK